MIRNMVFLWAVIFCFAGAAEDIKLKNLLEEAKVGDWALYEISGGVKMKQTVVRMEDDFVFIRVEMIAPNADIAIPAQIQKIPRNPKNLLPEGEARPPVETDISRGVIEWNGKEIECYIIEATVDGRKSKSYISEAVPINGIIRNESDGQLKMQLIEYGTE